MPKSMPILRQATEHPPCSIVSRFTLACPAADAELRKQVATGALERLAQKQTCTTVKIALR